MKVKLSDDYLNIIRAPVNAINEYKVESLFDDGKILVEGCGVLIPSSHYTEVLDISTDETPKNISASYSLEDY